jgi:hypothetical protein
MIEKSQVKHCKSIAEVARLLGNDSEGAILHILMLRDIETLRAESCGIKRCLQSVKTVITALELFDKEIDAETDSLLKLC